MVRCPNFTHLGDLAIDSLEQTHRHGALLLNKGAMNSFGIGKLPLEW